MDRPRRFDLFGSAIAGRPIEVAWGEPGDAAWTDGATIFVPPGASPTDMRAAVAVQASLLDAGSLDAALLAALLRRPRLTRRYLTVEAHRALHVHEHLLPPSVRGLVDREAAARSRAPSESLAIAGGRENLGEPPAIFGTIRPRRVETPSERRRDDAVSQHTPRRNQHTQRYEPDDAGGDDYLAIDLMVNPVGGGGGLGRLLKRLFGQGRSPQGGPPGADSPTHWSRAPTAAARAVAVSAASFSAPGLAAFEQRGTTYPEWDSHKERYKPDWCTVVESDPDSSALEPFEPPDAHALRRPLARLGIDLDRQHRQLQGIDIDIDATVDARVELEAGAAPSEAVYIDSVRRRRDLSVLLLLDVSGSANEPSITGKPVHEHQRAAAAALAVALHAMGDRVALYGFRSQGRTAVHILRVKRFPDRLDALAMRRLGGLVPGAYTRLGAAIRHGAAVLERDAGTSRRLLVVLSDGFAYDHGYERSYGEADASRALSESRRRGIGSVCLSVGARTDIGALRRVFGSSAHAAVSRIEDLPAIVGPLFRSALGSADRQRRISQRTTRTKERLRTERRTA